MIKATNNQITYIMQMVKNMDLQTVKNLPLPKELVQFAMGDINDKKIKEILSSYSINKAQNIINIINKTVL